MLFTVENSAKTKPISKKSEQEKGYMNPSTHYTPTKEGYAISGSLDIFNKLLYGSHQNDDKEARYSTS